VQYPLDFWHHLVTGRQIAQSGAASGPDLFTYTIAGQEIVNQSWLAQWIMYGLYRQGGFSLVQFVFAVCYALAVGLAGYTAWQRCHSARLAAALALVAMALAASNFGVRPQAMSLVLFAAELVLLWRFQPSPGTHHPSPATAITAIALIEMLWANSHGAFPLGVALPALFLLAAVATVWREHGFRAARNNRTVWIYLTCTAAALAAAFCNPHFRHTTDYFFVVASKSTQRQIGEWLPTELGTYTGTAFYVSLLLAIVVLACNRRRVTITEALLLLVFGMLGCTAQRMVVWWGLLLPTVLTPHLATMAQRWQKQPALPEAPAAANFVLLCLLLVWAAFGTPWTRAFNPLLPAAKRLAEPPDEPRAAVAWLRESGFAGRIFQPMEWGSYLSWHLYPQATIFADGRIDSFPNPVWNDYVTIGSAGAGWQSLLDRYRIDCVVWDPKLSQQLPLALRSSGRWEQVESDSVGVIFCRQEPFQAP
jgi:hypothetical protein